MRNNFLKLTYLLSALCCSLSSCGDNNFNFKDIVDVSTLATELPREQYKNSFTKEFIPEYWDAYGTGDPFVFRYNGMYYLYCSSPNYAYQVMGWKSKDLIHWEQCDNGINEKGIVGDDDCLYTAFAPEVCHFNGYFYMCESRRGGGHFILRSESPEGPFVPITDNQGQEIDGSFFIDSSEKMYFLRASHGGIRILEIDENSNDFIVATESRQYEPANLGSWTEGPGMFKRNGVYYLTYTGNNVTSAGYRVGYAYHKENEPGDFFDSDAFKQGNIILLNTSDEFNGLGHSSNVMGPNMDSMYIVYHNLVALAGPYRHYNLNRIMFNGAEMMIENPSLYDNFVPEMPEFYTYDQSGLLNEGEYKLSSKTSASRFTAELNAKGNTKMIFSFENPLNYGYMRMEVNGSKNELNLYRVTNGSNSKLASVVMNKNYNFEKNHSYRISHDNGKITVLFDDMEKINVNIDKPFNGGKIGYEIDAISSFTAFSNEAYDSSQRSEFKQNSVLADSYSEEVSELSQQHQGTFVQETEGNGIDGGHTMKLLNKNEHASYRTYFKEDGFYGIDITVPVSYMGKKVGIRIDNEPVLKCLVPTYDISDNVLKAHLTSFEAKKGEHYISVYFMGDQIEFTRLDWYKTSNMITTFSHKLDTNVTDGAFYVNSWKIKYGGHFALSGNRQLVYFGDDTLRNYSIEADMTFIGETEASTAGFLLRASNPAFQTNDDVNSVVGFYCGLNLFKTFISECNYNETKIGESSFATLDADTSYHVKAVINGNIVQLFIDGEKVVEYITSSGPTHGRAAFYTDGAGCVYKNLTINTL